MHYSNDKNFVSTRVVNLLHTPATSALKVIGMIYGDMCIPFTSALLKIKGKNSMDTKLEYLTYTFPANRKRSLDEACHKQKEE